MSKMTFNNERKNIKLIDPSTSPPFMDKTTKSEAKVNRYRRFSDLFAPPQKDEKIISRRSLVTTSLLELSLHEKQIAYGTESLIEKGVYYITDITNKSERKKAIRNENNSEMIDCTIQTHHRRRHHNHRRKSRDTANAESDTLLHNHRTEYHLTQFLNGSGVCEKLKEISDEAVDVSAPRRNRSMRKKNKENDDCNDNEQKLRNAATNVNIHKKQSLGKIESSESIFKNDSKVKKLRTNLSRYSTDDDSHQPTSNVKESSNLMINSNKVGFNTSNDKFNVTTKFKTSKRDSSIKASEVIENIGNQINTITDSTHLIKKDSSTDFDEIPVKTDNNKLNFDPTLRSEHPTNGRRLKATKLAEFEDLNDFYRYDLQISNNYEHPDILKYYTDRTIKKFNNLETIFEQPKGNVVMGSRKLRRFLNFEDSFSLKKQSKRKLKARKLNPFFRMESLNWNKLEIPYAVDLFN